MYLIVHGTGTYGPTQSYCYSLETWKVLFRNDYVHLRGCTSVGIMWDHRSTVLNRKLGLTIDTTNNHMLNQDIFLMNETHCIYLFDLDSICSWHWNCYCHKIIFKAKQDLCIHDRFLIELHVIFDLEIKVLVWFNMYLVSNTKHAKGRMQYAQAYIKKGRTPIQVLPVPNVYTTCCDKTSKTLLTTIQSSCLLKFGVRIRDRKYLNRCTPPFWCKPVYLPHTMLPHSIVKGVIQFLSS